MKLDATDLRYVTPEEFRVLMAVRILLCPFLAHPVTSPHITLG
jgi:hypothetical protein